MINNIIINKLLKSNIFKYLECNTLCNDNCKKNKCNLIQNYNLLLSEIPIELQNLNYGIYPDDLSYNSKRFIYNKLSNYFPHAIFYVNNINNISYLIEYLVKYNLKFSIRCGGHSYEGSSLSEGYIIDVKNLKNLKNSIVICNLTKTAKISSGLRLGYIIDELSKKSFITPTGTSSCVGISGISLAGGKGYLSRLYGLMCDNIISVKLINYQGKLINANMNENEDLFWALKGAGNCNFGIITEIELKIYDDIFCQFVTLKWDWDSGNIKILFELYQRWIEKFKNIKILNTDLNITYNNTTASFSIKFIKFNNKKFIEIDEFKNMFEPTITICNGYYSKIKDCWVNYDTGNNPPFSKIKSTMIFNYIEQNIVDKLIYSIDILLSLNYDLIYQLNFSQLGGQVENGISSYFPKKAISVLSIFIQWTLNDLTNFSKKYVNDLYDNIKEGTSEYCFANLTDYNIENYMNAYYGSNTNRLIQIKKKYDPNNVFNYQQSIPVNT